MSDEAVLYFGYLSNTCADRNNQIDFYCAEIKPTCVIKNCSRLSFEGDFKAYLPCIVELNKRIEDRYHITSLLTEISDRLLLIFT